MKETKIKRLHPAFWLGLVLFLICLGLSVLSAEAFTKNPEGNVWKLLSSILFLAFAFRFGRTISQGNWRLEAEGDQIVLFQGRKELYSGKIGDLTHKSYDFGMLKLEGASGRRFEFPPLGPLERFIEVPDHSQG